VTASENFDQVGDDTHGLPPVGDLAARHVARTCRGAVGGRRSARALANWVKPFGLSEPEFQLLWCLREESSVGWDQTTLAGCLAFSPAQVSASVERLRASGFIEQQATPGDRRRNLWQLAIRGQQLLQRMLAEVSTLRREISATDAAATDSTLRKDAA
jgi:DNA-binding MarR family transcriptional regulator